MTNKNYEIPRYAPSDLFQKTVGDTLVFHFPFVRFKEGRDRRFVCSK